MQRLTCHSVFCWFCLYFRPLSFSFIRTASVTWNEFYLFFRWIVYVNIDSKRHSIAMSAYHWNDSRLNENHISHGKHSVRVIWYDLVVFAIWTSDIEQRAHELSKEHAVSIRTKYAHFVCTAHKHTCTLTIPTNQRHLSYSMNIACDISSNEHWAGTKNNLWIMNAMSKSQSDTNKFNLM